MRTGQELLETAVCYALAGAAPVTPQLLPRPTPCASWDLQTLLDHLSDSIGVLGEAIATAAISPGPAQGYGGPGRNPVGRLRGQAVRLLGTSGDRGLTASMVAVTGAIGITVHGWDIFAACGAARPVSPDLAAVLLPIAPLLITPATRPGLFAGPVRLPGPAGPGGKLVAFLGRHPRLRAAPGPATAQAGHPVQPGAAIPPDPAGLYQ
jgi:uncharacterized protein (TIGR03086 family)